MRSQIRLMDHSGDKQITTYDPAIDDEVRVAQEELTAFLDDCVRRYGHAPPVWSRRNGETDFDEHDGVLTDKAEILVHPPLVGG